MERVTIEYFGHSCFRLSWQGQRIVLDPYGDGCVPGYPPLRTEAEFVYCSHAHADHNAAQCVKLHAGAQPKFSLTALETDHDEAGGTKRGKNTVRVFDLGGVRVAHLGDLGRKLMADELALLSDLDVLLIPVGGFFTIGPETAKELVEALRPRTVVPMHYRTENTGYDVLAPLDDFLALFDGEEPDIVPLTYGGHIELEK